MISAPNPDQCVCQGLLKDTTVTVPGGEAEHKAMLIPLGLERRSGAPAGHDPVVMRFLWVIRAIVVLRDVGENAQRFFLAVLDQFHTRMVLPSPQRVFAFLRRIVIL